MEVVYRVSPSVTAEDLNALFTAAWDEHPWIVFDSILCRSLGFVCAYRKPLRTQASQQRFFPLAEAL